MEKRARQAMHIETSSDLESRGWGFRRSALPADISVGAALLMARRAAGYERAAVSALLAIPERYLAALEEEDVAALPGLIYERNFLRRYATALGLDATELLVTWESLRREATAPVAKQFVARIHWRDLFSSPMMWRRGVATVAVLAVGFFLGNRLYGMVRPPTLALTSPTADSVTTGLSITVTGEADQAASVSINGQQVGVQNDGTFAVPVSLQFGANKIRVVATKRFGQPATIERQVFAAPETNQTSNAPLDTARALQ